MSNEREEIEEKGRKSAMKGVVISTGTIPAMEMDRNNSNLSAVCGVPPVLNGLIRGVAVALGHNAKCEPT